MNTRNQKKGFRSTSWEKASRWYKNLVEKRGSYYHENLVIPQSVRLLSLSPDSSLLDLGCGEGILARKLPRIKEYWGVDLARSLIETAKREIRKPNFHFLTADITRPLSLKKNNFSHAATILSLQNIGQPGEAIKNAARHLAPKGKLLVVINHPCFRIPRQSEWDIDKKTKIQYRRINRYLTPLSIPINIHPGQKRSVITWSFHFPLSQLSEYLSQSDFLIEKIEEWVSDKKSVGPASRMENRSRQEFPLFLALLCHKDKLR